MEGTAVCMQLELTKPKAQLLHPLDIKAGQGVMF